MRPRFSTLAAVMRIVWPKMTNNKSRPPRDPANAGTPYWRKYDKAFRWRVLLLRLWTVVLGDEAIERHLDFRKALRDRTQADWRWFIMAVRVEAAVAFRRHLLIEVEMLRRRWRWKKMIGGGAPF